jgi:tRNA 5-methylaminomethyl-2-thiouridine biosynthesis bifunctional protein
MTNFFLIAFPAIFTIVNPLGAVGPFLAMTARDSIDKRESTARRACMLATLVLIVCAAIGTFAFQFFGITLPALKIAGGCLLFLVGMDMINARESRARATVEEREEGSLKEDIAIALDVEEARTMCGISQSGVWISRGACLNLLEASKQLLKEHERLTCLWSTRITRLEECNGIWHLFDCSNNVLISAKKVVIATAIDSKDLINSLGVRLPLKPVRGQLSIFSIRPDDPWVSKLPKVGISGDGYCLPAEQLEDGSYRWIVGSSFDEGEDDLSPREASDEFNRAQAKGLLDYPEGDSSSLIKNDEFVGVRCVAGDRLPIIGALRQRPGIFLATALGSRGILWSALAAKLVTAQLLEDDFALLTRLGFAADLVAALAPARFLAGALAAPGALASNSKPIFPSEPSAK